MSMIFLFLICYGFRNGRGGPVWVEGEKSNAKLEISTQEDERMLKLEWQRNKECLNESSEVFYLNLNYEVED